MGYLSAAAFAAPGQPPPVHSLRQLFLDSAARHRSNTRHYAIGCEEQRLGLGEHLDLIAGPVRTSAHLLGKWN